MKERVPDLDTDTSSTDSPRMRSPRPDAPGSPGSSATAATAGGARRSGDRRLRRIVCPRTWTRTALVLAGLAVAVMALTALGLARGGMGEETSVADGEATEVIELGTGLAGVEPAAEAARDARRRELRAARQRAAAEQKAAKKAEKAARAETRRKAAKPTEGSRSIAGGEASFYHSSLEGRRTASGEAYRGANLTAAHRTLPFGSRVRVTNLANGREVTVRINDRGPFARRRVIDLSHSAAQKLGMTQKGKAPVELELLVE